MVNIKINDVPISVEEGTTILEACREAKMIVPTLCYLKDINEIGACRVCVVEIKGIERLVTSCNNTVKEGMEIYTNSPKVRDARRINIKLILSQHNCFCPTCVRSGNCQLQKVANDLEFGSGTFKQHITEEKWPMDFPLIRDESKCIKCMRCVQVCDKVQSLHIWDVAGTGSRTTVDVSLNRKIEEADCALCGQCITHCPVGALRERDDVDKVLEALADPDKITVVQMAPAVRAAWGEEFGLSREFATAGRLVAALRRIGFSYIFDTDFSADLTIMEEGSEFLEKLKHRDKETFPMFTSCCPGWVRFLKGQFPGLYRQSLHCQESPADVRRSGQELLCREDRRGPQAHLCGVHHALHRKKKRGGPAHHADHQRRSRRGCGADTREIVRMFRGEQINPATMEETPFDSPLGTGTGAAVIFGASGGVMDAALRSAYYLVTGSNPDPDAFSAIRGVKGWKEATFTIPKVGDLSVAVVSGLSNARQLMTDLEEGRVHYDFVEVMACPGGCAGGGGQPIHDGTEMAEARGNVLWSIDKKSPVRFSHENPEIQTLYREYLRAPLSGRSHHLLHTDHEGWKMPNQK